jgi:hypothetical protein
VHQSPCRAMRRLQRNRPASWECRSQTRELTGTPRRKGGGRYNGRPDCQRPRFGLGLGWPTFAHTDGNDQRQPVLLIAGPQLRFPLRAALTASISAQMTFRSRVHTYLLTRFGRCYGDWHCFRKCHARIEDLEPPIRDRFSETVQTSREIYHRRTSRPHRSSLVTQLRHFGSTFGTN